MRNKRRVDKQRKKEIQNKIYAMYAEIGRGVREARLSKNMEVDILAIITGVTPEHINRLERGTLPTSGYFLEKIARALEVPYQQIYPDIEDLDEWLRNRKAHPTG